MDEEQKRRRSGDARAIALDCLREAETWTQGGRKSGETVILVLLVKAIVFALMDVADAVRERPFQLLQAFNARRERNGP